MPAFRVEKNKDYTTMCNHHLRDENLTLKAKGLLSLFLSLPETWDYSIAGLSKICKEGRSGISSTLKELEECGYLVRERRRDEKGLLRDNIYVIYERPQEKDQHPEAENPALDNPALENPMLEKPALEKPVLENRAQLNTDLTNTDLLNTESNKRKREKEPRHQYGEYRNVLLSDSEMQTLQMEFPQDYRQRIERLSEYMASTGKSYKSHLATIRSWARRDRGKPTAKSYSHDNYRCEEGESL
ncbi:MAG: helix-turn-helix domain-containing protein [Clostridiales bacterium]|nr:helix-turn-helix domain-containing protein [Clostridiales bacterium]